MEKSVDEVYVTEDKGILKKIIKVGEEDILPENGQEVTVNYEGRLENGTVFDKSADHGEPLKFVIG